MKTSTSILALILIVTASIAYGQVSNESAPDPPNIIFFIADDVSQEDFGCYGHPTIQTPSIDALAANGMRFDNAYLTISSCSPSRNSIITGRYPHNTGAPELHVELPESQIRFPELLREAGYYTVLSGKNHMFPAPDRAFDKMTGGGGPSRSRDWVDHVRDRPKDQPFFFWFAASDAHRGWQETEHAPVYPTHDVVVPPYIVDTDVVRQDLAQYYHEVSRYDHYVGAVVEELERQGILDNTLIVVAADNGRPFPRDKARLYDSGIKTPWIVHYPPLIEQATVTQSLISSIDLSATCLELAGLDVPEYVQGQSFLPILQDAEADIRYMVFAEQNWHVYRNHSRMVRFGDYVYIKNNFTDQLNLSFESDTRYPSGEELWKAQAAGETLPRQQQIFAEPVLGEELFQVQTDYYQLLNLADEPAYEAALEKGRRLLALWTKQTGDTIPENPSPNRNQPPRIVDGKIVPGGRSGMADSTHSEMPGEARDAGAINHPGPIRFIP